MSYEVQKTIAGKILDKTYEISKVYEVFYDDIDKQSFIADTDIEIIKQYGASLEVLYDLTSGQADLQSLKEDVFKDMKLNHDDNNLILSLIKKFMNLAKQEKENGKDEEERGNIIMVFNFLLIYEIKQVIDHKKEIALNN